MMRQVRLRMPDDTIRSVMVPAQQPVANLMVIICTKLGITNHDEYSLIATGKHTINGRRKERQQDGRIIDQKMEQLKKKLKTDEDLAWVDHSKTLDEQEIHEQDVVLLRRRFFYSDQNIDTRDPLQLGLLYVQTRDAILSGTHPVTVDGACKFAGIQCQAQLGDFMEGKTTRPGYFNLRDYLPSDYAKIKHIERKIYGEHKKYYGLSELEAKARYVSEARSLSTYGVTFFLVKEKVPDKNKLAPRLLGITRDCVMRVDADTKGILKTWPLTTVKRWAASMNSFTLDFGDYADSYYSVQTTEGEQISQLIAGYIDIILKRRKAKDHFGIEGDEGATMIEDSVAPSRATIIQNQPALAAAPPQRPLSGAPTLEDLTSVAGPTVDKLKRVQGPIVEPPEFRPAVEVRGKAEIGYESRPQTQYVTNYELSLPQRDLQDRLDQAQDAVEAAQKVLDRQTHEVDRSRYEAREVEQKKRKLSNKFAEINAATAQLVSLSAIPEEELNYPALNSAVETVASSLPAVAKDVRIVASLMDDEESGERLVEAARRLCKAFSDLLNAAEPGPTVPRQSLISAASRVGDATQALLYTVNSDTNTTQSGGGSGGANNTSNRSSGDNMAEQTTLAPGEGAADTLLSLAKSVASSAAALVLKTKDVASACRDVKLQNSIISSATQCALATSQMVATAKIVAPTIDDPKCRDMLVEACREVQRAVEGIRSIGQRAIVNDEERLCELEDAVERVNHALEELLEHVDSIKRFGSAGAGGGGTGSVHRRTAGRQQQSHRDATSTNTTKNTTTTTTTTTTHKIIDEASGRPLASQEDLSNKNELMNEARNLARATSRLIQDIRPEGGPDSFHNNHSYVGREQHSQQPHSQQHSGSSTTKTITTTIYDERHADGARQDRPVSMYEHETGLAGHQDDEYYNETSRHLREEHLLEQQQHQHHEQQEQHQQQQQQQQQQHEHPEAAISGIVGDLETSIMFATSGTLRAQDENDNYLRHRENVLRCAKALVEDTRPLVASSASEPGQLARAAQESVITMSRLADTVKASAASLGPNNSESQVNLIRSVKDVAISLSDLIGSTKSAHNCAPNDPKLVHVKDSAKSMVTSVTSLLRTVKSVEDEQQRGCRAIETAIEAIEHEIANYDSQCAAPLAQAAAAAAGGGGGAASAADELARCSRPVTMATAKTVHAGSSGVQDDAIVAANMGRKAIVDLLQISLSAARTADTHGVRTRVQEAGRQCAISYKQLIEQLHRIFQHPSSASSNPEIKQDLINQSKQIAGHVNELVNCSELLKGTSWGRPMARGNGGGGGDFDADYGAALNFGAPTAAAAAGSRVGGDFGGGASRTEFFSASDDPTVIAESELLGAASSIDAAAKKLENLKPRVTSVKLPHEELNFDEIILEAAKSIIEATAALLRAASASQRELLVDGRLDETETFYASDNNQWSEGLVSAARMVAAATHSLVEAANALVQGQASEERLISAAKQVASSTNQLLVACKVKADPDSRTVNRLANAGNQVKRATDNLVRAAQQAIEHDEEQSLIISNRKVSGIAQEISAREQILRKEKELQVAKTQLMAIRKAKYANRPDDYQGYGGSLD